jgi:DNA-binding transcriptional regulator LsrR (DeoR family)
MVDAVQTVALAGGRTLYALAPNMTPAGKAGNLTLVQAMGCVGAVPEAWDSLEIGRTIAGAWSAPFLMLNTPALFPDAKTRNTMAQLPQIRFVLERLRTADLALVGVGTLENSIFHERQALDQDTLKTLAKAGAVGEICGHYYNECGEECRHTLRDRVAGMELDWLRRMDNVVAVVIGEDRAVAVLSAIRGGLVKSVVTNSLLGARMLELSGAFEKRDKR